MNSTSRNLVRESMGDISQMNSFSVTGKYLFERN
jgi:hypothetical protein